MNHLTKRNENEQLAESNEYVVFQLIGNNCRLPVHKECEEYDTNYQNKMNVENECEYVVFSRITMNRAIK